MTRLLANLAKKNLLLQLSDYRSAIFYFIARRRDEKSGSVYNKTLGSAIVSQRRRWRDVNVNITSTSAIAPPGDYRLVHRRHCKRKSSSPIAIADGFLKRLILELFKEIIARGGNEPRQLGVSPPHLGDVTERLSPDPATHYNQFFVASPNEQTEFSSYIVNTLPESSDSTITWLWLSTKSLTQWHDWLRR